MNINNVGAGVGMAVGPETIVGQNPQKYNVCAHKYQNHWISNDFTIGGTHVMHRVKLFHIFLDFMTGCTEVPFGYPVRTNLKTLHYDIVLDNEDTINEIDYEEFDYNIIKPGLNPFADSLVNEIWAFLRNLWLTRGGYTATILFNPEIDLLEFGSQFGPGMFNGTYQFTISDDGEWDADFNYDFAQIDNPYDTRNLPPEGRKGPFYAQDYSRMQSNAAKRSRKLAKPTWNIETGRQGDDFTNLLAEEEYLNDNIDFTFSHEYKDTGKWLKGKVADVPDKIGTGVNADNVHLVDKKTMYNNQNTIAIVDITNDK
jgi:hypothetical protein